MKITYLIQPRTIESIDTILDTLKLIDTNKCTAVVSNPSPLEHVLEITFEHQISADEIFALGTLIGTIETWAVWYYSCKRWKPA